MANHLFFNNIPYAFIESLIKYDTFFELIYHKNFNPRIIEIVVDNGEWKNHEAADFPVLLKDSFDNPEKLWKQIYENQISMFSRCSLAILATFNTNIYLDDFKKAIKSFADNKQKTYGFSYNSFDVTKSLRELQNTFIHTTMDIDGRHAINFQNPSIRDFLVHYLSQPENKQLLIDILETAVAMEQLTGNITSDPISDKEEYFLQLGRRIIVSADVILLIRKEILARYEILKCFRLSQYHVKGSTGIRYYYAADNEFSKLEMLSIDTLYLNHEDEYHQLIVTKMQTLLSFKSLDYTERRVFVKLFSKLYPYINYEENDLVDRFARNISYITDWSDLADLNKIMPNGVKHFKSNVLLFNERYHAAIQREKESESHMELWDFTIRELLRVGEALEFNVAPEVESLQILPTYSTKSQMKEVNIVTPSNINSIYLDERAEIINIFTKMLANTD